MEGIVITIITIIDERPPVTAMPTEIRARYNLNRNYGAARTRRFKCIRYDYVIFMISFSLDFAVERLSCTSAVLITDDKEGRLIVYFVS